REHDLSASEYAREVAAGRLFPILAVRPLQREVMERLLATLRVSVGTSHHGGGHLVEPLLRVDLPLEMSCVFAAGTVAVASAPSVTALPDAAHDSPPNPASSISSHMCAVLPSILEAAPSTTDGVPSPAFASPYNSSAICSLRSFILAAIATTT